MGVCAIASGGACEFSHGRLPPSDGPIDTPADENLMIPSSCFELHVAHPTFPSGMYEIDPDGTGTEQPINVLCDMNVAGGGWTILFTATTDNYSTPPNSYTVSSGALQSSAQRVLLAYRDSSGVVKGTYAEFDMQPAWRSSPPFVAPGTDVMLPVAIDGATPTTALLRYGRNSFAQNCNDAWILNDDYGRICIANTRAPFFNGFANSWTDMCTESMSPWYSRACAADVLFSIAVR